MDAVPVFIFFMHTRKIQTHAYVVLNYLSYRRQMYALIK